MLQVRAITICEHGGRQAPSWACLKAYFFMCGNCGDVSSTWSSLRIRSEHKSNSFAVNVLVARAMQATGNRQTALNDVFSIMNISRYGLHTTKTWQRYAKQKLTHAEDYASRHMTSECAHSVPELYGELCVSNPGNITVFV